MTHSHFICKVWGSISAKPTLWLTKVLGLPRQRRGFFATQVGIAILEELLSNATTPGRFQTRWPCGFHFLHGPTWGVVLFFSSGLRCLHHKNAPLFVVLSQKLQWTRPFEAKGPISFVAFCSKTNQRENQSSPSCCLFFRRKKLELRTPIEKTDTSDE